MGKERMSGPAIVLDTNVFVAAAFRPGSASRRLVEAVRRGELRLVWDDATRRETETVLGRIPVISADDMVELFREEHRFRGATDSAAFAAVPDPEDRKFAALAAAAGATLVSMDRALLGAAGAAGFTALPPGAFLARITGG